jgi:hypothetical protein
MHINREREREREKLLGTIFLNGDKRRGGGGGGFRVDPPAVIRSVALESIT